MDEFESKFQNAKISALKEFYGKEKSGFEDAGRVGFENGKKVKFPQNQHTKISGNSLNDPDYLEILNERIWQKKSDGSLLYEDTAFRDLAAPNGNVITNREMRELQKLGYKAQRQGKKFDDVLAKARAEKRLELDPNRLKDKAKELAGRNKKTVIHHGYPKRVGEDLTKLIVDKTSTTLFSEAEGVLQNLDAEKQKLLNDPTKNKKRINEIQAIEDRLKKGKTIPEVTSTSTRTNKPVTKTNVSLKPQQKGLYGYENVDIDAEGNVTKKLKGVDTSKTIAGLSDDPITKIDLRDITPKTSPKVLQKMQVALNAKIPGITDLFVMAESIPGDLAKKKYLMAGVKSLGVLATPLIVYGAYDDFNKGIPVAEIIERNLIGTDLVKGTKEYMSLSPEGKEARDVVKQAEIRDQIDQDESMLDTDFDQPTVKSDFNLEEAAAKYKSEQDDFAEDRTAQEGQTASNRKTGFQNLKDRVFGISLDDITKEYYNQGGRVGYADGPKDPKRRTVIKGLTALAALPIIGKYFKLAKSPKAAAAIETAMEKVSGMPDWFQPFVNKVLKMGDDVTDTAATAEREIVKRIDIEDATVDVHYNTATNDVRVEVVGGKNAFDEPLEMQYKAPEVIEETGKKTKGEFSAAESRPVQTSPDDIELDGYDTDVLDDLLSETDYLEGFATGKIRTPAEIKKAKLRAKMREDAQRDPGSLLDDFDD